MSQPETVFVYGAGGHAKVVIDMLERTGVFIGAVLDDDVSLHGQTILGYSIQHTVDVIESLQERGIQKGIVAIGNNRLRCLQAASLTSKGFELISAFHPHAAISSHATIGDGTVAMAGTVVNPSSTIGDNVILNTGCTIDHDCVIGDGAHIGPGVNIGGSVEIGERTLIGTGSSVLHNAHIGEDVIVGAGAAVISDLPARVKAVGVPARVIHE